MVVLLSFEWSVDWTDRFILKGGIGIFYTFLRSVFVLKNLGFRIGWSLLLADFPFFSIWFSVFVKNTCLMGYGFGFRWSFWIVLFGFRFLFDPSGHYAPLRLHWSRIAAKPLYAPLVNTVSDRLGFWELGYEHLSVFKVLHAVLGSDRIFFCGFAVVDDFCDGFEVLNRTSHISGQWSSKRILALQIENLSF